MKITNILSRTLCIYDRQVPNLSQGGGGGALVRAFDDGFLRYPTHWVGTHARARAGALPIYRQ